MTDEEILAALAVLHQRKQDNVAGFNVVEELDGALVVRVPVGAPLEKDDIVIVLERLNYAVAAGHADITFSVKDGTIVKKGWINFTLKGGDRPPPSTGGSRARREF